jgi:AcrR family transcriptional regulator
MARTAAPGSRERILRTAAGLFYRHGVRAVGMAQVIEQAGCGKNLLYGHFPSKNDLVAAYLEETRTLRERSVEKALAAVPGDDPAAALVALTAEIAGLTARRDYRGCAFRNYLTEFPAGSESSGGDAPGDIARAYVAETRDRIDDLVARLGVADPQRLADRIWLVIEGVYATANRPYAEREGAAAVELVKELVSAD